MSNSPLLLIKSQTKSTFLKIKIQASPNDRLGINEKCKNEKNCQIVWFFVVIFWQSNSWLLGNCQPIVWMVCRWKENCQMKRIIRWKEFRRQEMYALAESWNQGYGCYNISLLGRHLTANLPNRGKHVAHDGQARYPSWASSVPNFSPNPSLELRN